MTYRLGAHSTSDDPSLYRKEEEVSMWKNKDPILRLRLYLEKLNAWNPKKEDELNKSITQQITEAVNIAKKTARPPLKSLIEDVYFEVTSELKKKNLQKWREHKMIKGMRDEG